MNASKVNSINTARLSSWKDKLNREHATPVVMVGVGHDHKSGQLSVITTEDRTDYELMLLLKQAVRTLEAKIVGQN